MAISKLADQRITPGSHGGTIRGGKPTVIVVHSMETPIQNGRAYQSCLYVKSKGLSVQYFVDPGEIVASVDEALIGWGAGNVNSIACHIEFAGYARYNRAQWLKGDTEPGEAMIQRGAALVADIAGRNGIPLRWLTDAQLKAAYTGTGPGGLTTHAQCSRVLGGTTHTDPGNGFPLDLLTQGDAMVVTKDDEKKIRSIVADELDKFLTRTKITAMSYADLANGKPARQVNTTLARWLGLVYSHVTKASALAMKELKK